MQLIHSAVGMRLEDVLGGANEGADEDFHHAQRAGSTPLILWAVEGHELKIYLAGNEEKMKFILTVITGTGFGLKREIIETMDDILRTLIHYGVMTRPDIANSLPQAFREVPVSSAVRIPEKLKRAEQTHLPWWNGRDRVAS